MLPIESYADKLRILPKAGEFQFFEYQTIIKIFQVQILSQQSYDRQCNRDRALNSRMRRRFESDSAL